MKPEKKLDLTKVRTRYEPPTLEEAIFAAQGITPDFEQQVEIAARLTGTPEQDVRSAVQIAQASVRRDTNTRVAGVRRSVIVERRAQRVPPRMARV